VERQEERRGNSKLCEEQMGKGGERRSAQAKLGSEAGYKKGKRRTLGREQTDDSHAVDVPFDDVGSTLPPSAVSQASYSSTATP
jgi:hypothetical protein